MNELEAVITEMKSGTNSMNDGWQVKKPRLMTATTPSLSGPGFRRRSLVLYCVSWPASEETWTTRMRA